VFVKCKLGVFIYFPHYNIPEIGSFKKELVEAAGFELECLNYESGILRFSQIISN